MQRPKKILKPGRIASALLTLARHVFMIGVSYVVLYPIMYMISNAIKPIDQFYDPSIVWIPKGFTWENFWVVTLVIDLKEVLLNTLIIEIIPAFISAGVCMLIGYALARFTFPGKKLVMAGLILTIIVPQQTIATSLYAVFRRFDVLGILQFLNGFIPSIEPLNLIGTPWVTLLPSMLGVGLKSGIFIFIYMQFFNGLPKELQEAAAIDGCGPFHTFLRIIVPTAQNIGIAVLLLAIVWNWNDYYTPSMFIRTQDTIATAMASFQKNLENLHNMGLGMNVQTAQTQVQAACLIAIVPLVVLYIFLQRRFAEGIENSGLTGI